jgi:septum site-determining protein MinD
MGKIIAIHSYKGGTGKTLLSINLAATYVAMGKNVCLMDLDFRAPSLHVPFEVQNSGHWLNDYLNGACEISKVLIDYTEKYNKGGRFLVGFANPTTEAIRAMLAKDRKWEMKALGRILALKTSLLNNMGLDYLILDTSPGLQYSSINAIVSAEIALVITSMDGSDLDGTQRMISELYDLFEKKTGIILNKVPSEILSSKTLKRNFSDRLTNTYNLRLLETIPCFCDILKAGGAHIFTFENPNHIFTEMLRKATIKIANL